MSGALLDDGIGMDQLFSSSWEMSHAMAEQAITDTVVVARLSHELRRHLGIEALSPESLRWHAQVVLENWSSGEQQPFAEEVVETVLGSLHPLDVFAFDCLRAREAQSPQRRALSGPQPYLKMTLASFVPGE